jgi:hypothetical protein
MADHNLPGAYGKTHLVLLPVDPYLIHAYWKIAPEILGKAKEQVGLIQAVLRFWKGNKTPAENPLAESFEVEIDLLAPNWYVPLWTAEECYRVDLALKQKDGAVILLVQSQLVQMPRPRPAMTLDQRFMSVDAARRRAEIIPSVPQSRRPPEVQAHIAKQQRVSPTRRLAKVIIDSAEAVREKLKALYRSVHGYLRSKIDRADVPSIPPAARSAIDLTAMAEAKVHSAISSDSYHRSRKEGGSDPTK